MSNNKNLLRTVILTISLIVNIVLAFCLVCFLSIKTIVENIPTDEKLSQNIVNEESAELPDLNDSFYNVDLTNKNHVYHQFFYGTWKIVKTVAPDFSLPNSYSGFNEDGTPRGPDTSTIIGMEITFSAIFQNDNQDENRIDYNFYVEFSGEKYELVYGPRTYSYSLLSENDQIGFYEAKTLDITGNYYSRVFFLLPDNWRLTGGAREKEMRINDLCYLYLKNNDTIYASDGTILYLLERISVD